MTRITPVVPTAGQKIPSRADIVNRSLGHHARTSRKDMPMTQTGPRVSRDLADYHAVIAADIKDFTSNTDTGNWLLARRLPQVLEEAFARSGLDFSRQEFPGQAGDGYAAGFDYHQLPHLIHPLLDHLQDVLAERDVDLRAQDRRLRMRLRASIHIGPLPAQRDPDEPAGIGKAMNDLHRLLDADPVREALSHTDPDTTFVAAVISQRAYEDAIQSGACALPASRLIPVHAQVKQFSGHAWLYVPQLSGEALHRVFTDGNPEPRADASAPRQVAARGSTTSPVSTDAVGPTFHIGNAGQVADTVSAPVSINQTVYGTAALRADPGDSSQHSRHNPQPRDFLGGES